MVKFPEKFLWGAATSSYQVEGNNKYSDWWKWEQTKAGDLSSGLACNHYELFAEDFDLARSLNHNAHRLSIEWSRIEPFEGQFQEQEIKHYQEVIRALRARGLEPMVTLHHFTNPQWFIERGGWEKQGCLDYFLRFTEKIVDALAGDVRYWMTINEPLVYVYYSYILGQWPPQEKSTNKARRVIDNFVLAHIRAYHLINKIYRENNFNKPLISIAQHMRDFSPCPPTLRNKIAVYLRNRSVNFEFLDNLFYNGVLDFIGINYYTRELVDVKKWKMENIIFDVCAEDPFPLKKNSLGWDIYPQGLYNLLLKLKKYNLPVIITENGICTEDDSLRWEFIRDHLIAVNRAIQAKVKVQGYLYWSLIDNFEWDKGFVPKFGMIGIDYSNYKRTIRDSARKLAEVYRSGVLA